MTARKKARPLLYGHCAVYVVGIFAIGIVGWPISHAISALAIAVGALIVLLDIYLARVPAIDACLREYDAARAKPQRQHQ
ncbi:hypothetical protein AB4Y45_34620 [Paraburkholderia sp. EG287A]|uniref:hypothetical protein n=1 Tax=Paraburkholderia sp. EG287A TaxID=3237012 RepID=UPI0034D1B18E